MKTESFITFEPLPPAHLTKRWGVVPKQGGGLIGRVQWYGPWRKYCFFPEEHTVFEQVCLRDIATFCETETQSHHAAKKLTS